MSINSQASYQARKARETRAVVEAATAPAPPENGLTRYIPTETVTLYVATLAALGAFRIVGINLTGGAVYVIGIVLSVVWFAAQYYLKEKQIKSWRFYWGLISTPIAFAVWGLAVPGNPILDIAPASVDPTAAQVAGGTVAAVLALIISSVLTLVENVLNTYFTSRQSTPPAPPPAA